ncbi:MAG: hypothetical protein PF692_07890 [Kiritimatiellae bacterium]|nr:hypothetical protein [Kiritimatiellia bacterium]
MEPKDNTYLKGLLRIVGTTILLVLPVAVMLWLWEDARGVPLYVLSGKLFQSSWWHGHVGTALDQPTIGKWYFWTTIFSGAWALFVFCASLICKSCSCGVKKIFATFVGIEAVIYLCLLSLPFTWTIQYIHAMGWTQRRLIALAWGITGYIVIVILSYIFIKKILKKIKRITTPTSQAK